MMIVTAPALVCSSRLSKASRLLGPALSGRTVALSSLGSSVLTGASLRA